MDDRGHPELPVLSATQDLGMIRRDNSGRYVGHDTSNEVGYKRVIPGSFVVHLRSFQGGFAHSPIEGITSPAYTVFAARCPSSQSDRFWKHWFMSPRFIHDLGTVTYGIRDGRSINVDEFMDTLQAYPSFEEQKLIGLTLDSLDSLITLHQRKRGMFGIRNGAWSGMTKPLALRTPRTVSSPFHTPTVARIDEADGADAAATEVVSSERPFSLRGMPRAPGGDRLEP